MFAGNTIAFASLSVLVSADERKIERARKQKTAGREKKEKLHIGSSYLLSPKAVFAHFFSVRFPYYLGIWNRLATLRRSGEETENVEKENKLKGLYMVVGVKFSFDPFSVSSTAIQVSKLI